VDMIQVLPEPEKRPSFGRSFRRELENIPQLAREFQQSAQEGRQNLQKLYAEYGLKSRLEQEKQAAKTAEKLKLLGMLPGFGKRLAGEQSREADEFGDTEVPEMDMKEIFDPAQLSDQDILAATIIDPNIGRMLESQKEAVAKEKTEERKSKEKKEGKYFAFNEPKLAEIADSERKLSIENARYNRLGELFSDPTQFPSGLLASLVTRDGQINDVAYSQLSPSAQEALKLIIDSTSNIKDTYGARVTNFDLQTYLRKLPSLLNSPEGKMRVLRDLQTVNRVNQLYNRGIQEVFDDAGGSDKIPFSTAEKKFKKKYGDQLNSLLEDFATGDKRNFKELPDAKKYLGKRIKDDETGEILISDGTSWKPVGQ